MPGEFVTGHPAFDHQRWRKASVDLPSAAALKKRVDELEHASPSSRRSSPHAGHRRISLMHREAFAALLTVILAAVPAVRAGAQSAAGGGAGAGAARVPAAVQLSPDAPPTIAVTEDDADERFSWDTHFGGSFDLVDYVAGRASVTIDYQAVLGSEFRPFDPNQGNYILEASLSGRARRHGNRRRVSSRLAASQRSAEAWRYRVEPGWRPRPAPAGPGRHDLDVDVDIGRVVQQSFVDYTWIGRAELQVRRDVNPHVGVFAHASGQVYGVDTLESGRGRQRAGMAEAGVRLRRGWRRARAVRRVSSGASTPIPSNVSHALGARRCPPTQ